MSRRDPKASPDPTPYDGPPILGEQPPLPAEQVPGDVAPHEAHHTPPQETLKSPTRFTRAGALWTATFFGFLILIVLLVFIMQNTDSITVHLFGWSWNLPAGVAILFAAVGGGLITVAAGTVRIFQLRRAAKKSYKAASR
jgi:uncharacterized integral membrane protein